MANLSHQRRCNSRKHITTPLTSAPASATVIAHKLHEIYFSFVTRNENKLFLPSKAPGHGNKIDAYICLGRTLAGYLNTLSAERVISLRIYLATSLNQSQDNDGRLFGEPFLYENDSTAFMMSGLPKNIFNCTTLHQLMDRSES